MAQYGTIWCNIVSPTIQQPTQLWNTQLRAGREPKPCPLNLGSQDEAVRRRQPRLNDKSIITAKRKLVAIMFWHTVFVQIMTTLTLKPFFEYANVSNIHVCLDA